MDMDKEELEGLDTFTLARIVRIQADRRAVMPMAPPSARMPPPSAKPVPPSAPPPAMPVAETAAWEAGWKAGRSEGWQEGWDLRSAVDVIAWYVNSRIDL